MKTKKLLKLFGIVAALCLVAIPTSLTVKTVNAADVKTYSYTSSDPFFNDYMDNVYKLDNDTDVDYWFAKLPPTTNTNRFCGLGTSIYNDINGETVTVDSFYRNNGDSLNDPNYGQGILIYLAIQYKVAHPEENVEIYFSTYRMSATAAVCVDPNSKYFGYMRSIFDGEYDNHGFIRISFMLIEAARMGIKVVLVPQLNSYAVAQYSATASKKYANKTALSYKTYFDSAAAKKCYSKYANGKTVNDFLDRSYNLWNVNERGMDMQHLKACCVSNYRDYDGKEYKYGLFLESANLDDNDYLGRNGNKGSQSGVIVTNHEQLYNCCKNYINLIAKYRQSHEISKFRDYVSSTQREQVDLFNQGLYETIPMEKRLCYLGSDSDNVFEIYFTPLPGGVGVWDKTYMPYCRYLSKMLKSEDYIVFTWNMPYNECVNPFEFTFEDIICESFHKNLNKKNRLYMHFESFDATKYNDLKVGTDIGFMQVNTNLSTYIHSKDMLLSYVEGGERKYTSIISSCNFGNGPFWYRSNSVLVVKEDEYSHDTYTNLGAASTYGCIEKEEKGMQFKNITDRYSLTKTFDTQPLTFESSLECNADVSNNKGCTILGNYFDEYLPGISFRIYLNGRPSLCLRYDRNHQDQYTFPDSILGKGKVHIAITIDSTNVYGYLNGKLVLTKNHCGYLPEMSDVPFSLGGDIREDNSWWFRNGKIYTLNVFDSCRTASEIAEDIKGVNSSNEHLMLSYDFSKSNKDQSVYHNDIYPYFYKGDFIDSSAYDYTFAVIGDTQSTVEQDPELNKQMYQWLVDNKEQLKIERVIGMGDITNTNSTTQWEDAKEAISLLNGQIPYSLVRGNHDVYTREEEKKAINGEPAVQTTSFVDYFDDSNYRSQISGAYENDIKNTYFLSEIGGTKYLFINLDYGASDSILNWAGELCETYTDYNVVVSTHCFLFRDKTTLDETDVWPPTLEQLPNDGDDMWDKFVSKHSNISLVLCGHDPSNNIVYNKFTGDYGNTVTSVLVDQQYVDKYMGSSGIVTLFHFSDNGKTIQIETFSTVQNKFYKLNNQFIINDISCI